MLRDCRKRAKRQQERDCKKERGEVDGKRGEEVPSRRMEKAGCGWDSPKRRFDLCGRGGYGQRAEVPAQRLKTAKMPQISGKERKPAGFSRPYCLVMFLSKLL